LARLSRQYCKLCELEDFDVPELRAMLREIIGAEHDPGLERHRKYWEYAMLGLYLDEVGALTPDARVLSVAAGHEEPLYWLANRVGEVVATDIYGDGAFAGNEATGTMLEDPAAFAPYAYREDHLRVQEMDALDLRFDDGSFDVVFSLSSIEHFGAPSQIRTAAAEMARVTRPGGHLVIVTELLLEPHPLDWRPVQVATRLMTGGRRAAGATLAKRANDGFRPRELQRDVIAATGLTLVQPLETAISPSTRAGALSFGDGSDPRTPDGARFPHIVLKGAGAPWTSAFLAFHKPGVGD
jgi:SAM-dependent methyltransferase